LQDLKNFQDKSVYLQNIQGQVSISENFEISGRSEQSQTKRKTLAIKKIHSSWAV